MVPAAGSDNSSNSFMDCMPFAKPSAPAHALQRLLVLEPIDSLVTLCAWPGEQRVPVYVEPRALDRLVPGGRHQGGVVGLVAAKAYAEPKIFSRRLGRQATSVAGGVGWRGRIPITSGGSPNS